MLASPLVQTDQLAADMHGWTIVDASVEQAGESGGTRAYRASAEAFLRDGHIPGARFADLAGRFSDPGGPFPFTRPRADQFQEAARALGVSNRDRIVVYDRSSGIWAARLWWLFRAFGHDDIAVLDGGFVRWRRQGRPISHEAAGADRGDFEAREQTGFFVDKADVAAIVAGQTGAQLINVLRRPVHAGLEQNHARPGHIPGSANVPYAELLDGTSNRLRAPDALAAAFAATLADPAPIVTYCGGGITAAGAALVLATLGRSDVAVYDGSLNEWAADPTLPLVVAA